MSAEPRSSPGIGSFGDVLWLTGPPAAGKTTLALAVVERLRARGARVEILDGDEMRHVLSSELGFSRSDREKHIRRVAAVAELLARNGVTVVVALVSPYRSIREEMRALFARFVEIHVTCPLETLVARDPKGLYRRAMAGEIHDFTGIDAPYEAPLSPELTIDTSMTSTPDAADQIVRCLDEHSAMSA